MAWLGVIFVDEVEQVRGNIVRESAAGKCLVSCTAGGEPLGPSSARLQDGAVIVVSGIFEVKPVVISPWPLADLDQPCLYWLSLQIRFRPPQHNEQRTLVFIRERTEAAVETRVARTEPGQQRLELIIGACHVGVVAYLISCFLFASPGSGHQRTIREAGNRNNRVGRSSTKGYWSVQKGQCVQEANSQRSGVAATRPEGPPSLEVAWWRWRRVFGVSWSCSGEHSNVLELRTKMAAVQMRMQPQWNVHSRNLHGNDSFVALALGQRARRL